MFGSRGSSGASSGAGGSDSNQQSKQISTPSSSSSSVQQEKEQKKLFPSKFSVSGNFNNYGMIGGSLAVAFGLLVVLRYRVSSPSQYIVKTGLGITDINISKKTVVWPFQRYEILDVRPQNFSFILHAMSREKMEFQLPVQFTIGPQTDEESLRSYSIRLSDVGPGKMEELVKGIIEGGTRSMAANLSIEEIFSDRIKFKSDIKTSVQQDLNQFGLYIYNANIKEMMDTEGSEYFIHLRQRTKEGAVNQAKIEVAEARLRGDVGEKERQGESRRNLAKIEAETKIFENARMLEIQASETELSKAKSQYKKEVDIAAIEAQKASAIREAELQKDVELKRASQQIERMRADELSQATVKAEALVKTAEGEAIAKQRIADAELYSKLKESEGLYASLAAKAKGLNEMTRAFNDDTSAVINYLMIESDLYPKLAEETAKAIQGLNPKITVWNTSDGTNSDPAKIFRDLGKTLPPLLSTIKEQTGITPPSWMINMPDENVSNSIQKEKK